MTTAKPTVSSAEIPEHIKADDAFRRVISFAQHYGEPHTRLAMHAALPLGLTPELLHLIRVNFAIDVPWIAEADLLLSPFCKEKGKGLYEMEQHIREILLSELKNDKKFGAERVRKVAKFLLEYVRRWLEKEDNAEMREFLTVQKWTGLAYADSQEAVRQLALELKKGLEEKDQKKIIEIARVTQLLITPLIFEDKFLLYVAGVEKWTAGDKNGAFHLFDVIGPRDRPVNIGGVFLPAPNKLIGSAGQIHTARTVLIFHQQKNISDILKEFLGKDKCTVYTASSMQAAKKIVRSEKFDYLIHEHSAEAVPFFYFVRRNKPEIKTIILGTYPFHEIKEEYKAYLKNDSESEKALKSIEDSYIEQNENFCIAISKKLKELEKKKEKKKCLVIMPCSDTSSCDRKEWLAIFEEFIKPAVEESGFNYQCIRANPVHGRINESVIDELNRSELVIADLTDKNPHVFYELGIRHGLRDKTILISQKVNDIPADFRDYIHVIYGWRNREDSKKFNELIHAAIAEIEEDSEKTFSPVKKYLHGDMRS